jgi:hypothetical protein
MKDYSKYLVNKQSKHSRKITVAMIQAERLRVKNERRAKNGLPPKQSYAAI